MLIDKQTIEKMITDKIETGEKKFGAEFKICIVEILSLQKMLMPEEEKKQREIPLSQWNLFHTDPSVPALRMMWHRRKENGFEDVVTRRGKRLLILEDNYFKWNLWSNATL